MLRQSRPDRRQEREDRRNEDGASTTHQVVDRVTDPAGEEGDCDVGSCVDKADDPSVVLAQLGVWIGGVAVWDCVGDAELAWEG